MRGLTSAENAALAADVVHLAIMVRLDFESGVIRLWTGTGTLESSEGRYYGVGGLGNVNGLDETLELSSKTITMTLTGIPEGVIDFNQIALQEDYLGRDCRIYLVLLDKDYQIVGRPRVAHRGRMDVMSVVAGPEATISLTSESRLSNWQRPRVRRFNHEDQRINYPDDKGFEFIDEMVEIELPWGVGNPP